MSFTEQKFTIPPLKGISQENIAEHLKLYAGYVKNANSILEKIPEYNGYAEKDLFAPYVVGELSRRFSFEYNGMRNHEVYFASLEWGATSLAKNGSLHAAIEKNFGSFDAWLATFKKSAAAIRGIGWMVLWYDRAVDKLISSWVDEQHLGQLNGCKTILALDMWEHAYVADYQPSGKKNYIEDFFANLNWRVVEENFASAFSK